MTAIRAVQPGSCDAAPVCYHGGAFFDAIGDEFKTLERSSHVIAADVLDAWFPPAPAVVKAVADHLPWLMRTSPPTSSEGLVRAIARARGIPEGSVLTGGGSSDLIFLALTRWLNPRSRVLILDPMYGEYQHVLERVIGCHVDRLCLERKDGYTLDPARLLDRIRSGRYDLVILVNPNSPTGRHVPRATLEPIVARASRTSRIWIDETYVDYAGDGQSLEVLASKHEGIVVCKSMSKAYALSGVRVGYLCATRNTIASLAPYSPPWAVGLIGQVAAVRALDELAYYRAQWALTHTLREALGVELRRCGMDVVPGIANFLLAHIPEEGPSAAEVVQRAREHDLFLRDAGPMGTVLGSRAIRIAVKDAETNGRMVAILSDLLSNRLR